MPVSIEYGGRSYAFEELDLDVDEAETIQKYVGRSLGDFANGLATCEVKSLTALWWLLRKQAGENPGAIAAKVPGFKPLRLFSAYVDGLKAEAARVTAEEEAKEAAAVPDPTGLPSASSPERGGTTTTPARASAAPDPSQPG